MPTRFDAWCICGLIVMGIASICVIIIMLHFVIQSTKHFGCKGLDGNKLVIFSICTMTTSIIYISIDWVRIYDGFISNRANVDHWKVGLLVVNDIIYYVSNLLLYITLILRLKATLQLQLSNNNKNNNTRTKFKSTGISKIQIILLIFLLFCDVIAIGVFIFSIYSAITQENNSSDGTILILSAVVLITNDLMINGILLYVFLNKLYHEVYYLQQSLQQQKLIRTRDQMQIHDDAYDSDPNAHVTIDDRYCNSCSASLADHNHHNDNDTNSTETETVTSEVKRNKHEQNDIVDLMTKISLLTIFCVIFAQFWNVSALYTEYNEAQNNPSSFWYSQHVVLCFSFRAMEGVVNSIGLHFTFVFNHDMYMGCCVLCHNCLKNACMKCIVARNINTIEAKSNLDSKYKQLK